MSLALAHAPAHLQAPTPAQAPTRRRDPIRENLDVWRALDEAYKVECAPEAGSRPPGPIDEPDQ